MQEGYVNFGNCVGLINLQTSKKGILFYSGFFGDKNESRGLFKNYIPVLQKQGFSTLRFDLAGLGESDKSLEDVNLSTWRGDTYRALDFFRASGIERIGIVGFSLGATHAILNYLKTLETGPKIVGLALWAPAFNPREDMLERYKQNGDYEKSVRGELIKSGKVVTPDILDSLDFDVLKELENVDCPILICHSNLDPFIPVTTSKSLEKRIQDLYQLFIPNNSGHSFKSLEDSQDHSPRNLVYEKTLRFFQRCFK